MHTLHLLTFGAIGMMFAYVSLHYFYSLQKEYLYLGLYQLFVLMNLTSYFFAFHQTSRLQIALNDLSITSAPVCSFIANLLFMQKILEIKIKLPHLHKVITGAIIFLCAYLVMDIILSLFYHASLLRIYGYNTLRVLLILFSIPVALIAMRNCGLAGKYFLAGLIVYVFMGACATVIQLMHHNYGTWLSMLLYRTGVLIEILFFSIGISLKIKHIIEEKTHSELQLSRGLFYKEQEKQQAIINERRRISADLHDDIGATLTSISIFSEAAAEKLKDSNIAETKSLLERISLASRDMVSVMSDYVWAINPANDSFQKLTDHMQSYASSVLSAKNIRMNFEAEDAGPLFSLKPGVRKELFLIFKEAVNNAAKYADADTVSVSIKAVNGTIEMIITDNGKGFSVPSVSNGEDGTGNGLKNMNMRAEEINAHLNISSGTQGTRIELLMDMKSEA